MSRFADPSSRELPVAGDRVLVAGLRRSGEAAARALAALGARLTLTDDGADEALRVSAGRLHAERVVLGGMSPDLAGEADLIVASPAIPPSAPLLQAATAARVPVWSEVELGSRLSDAPILGVTGTNGKTTTTQMVAAALTAAGIPAAEAGNIGTPLTSVASGHPVAIACELSSFQLHYTVSFRAPVAVLLNIDDDHLDWHGSFAAYAADKGRVFANQQSGDVAVVFDDDRCRAVARTEGSTIVFRVASPQPGGAGVEDGWIVVPEGRVVPLERTALRGPAMIADAVAAAAAACAFGADPARAGEALAAFRPAPHRMEPVATIGGIEYVNDSKATNPHAALAALEGLERVVLVAGGRNKSLDLTPLSSARSVVAVVAIGESASEIERAFAGRDVPVVRAASMDEAVDTAAALAKSEHAGTVLLSPACASFDWFADYKARGEAFRAAVKRLPGGMP